MKTILVPVDFSRHAEYAVEAAAQIAKEQEAEIILLHMMDIPESYLTKNERDEIFNNIYFMKITNKKFDELLEKDYLQGVKKRIAVRNHKVFSEIDKVAQEYHADLIVMGSHGVTGITEAFMGSNTEKVVRTSHIPVLVIKNRMEKFSIKNPILLTDFEPESKNAFQRGMEFFEIFGVKPKIIFINIPEKFINTEKMHLLASEFFEDSIMDNQSLKESIVFYDDYSTEMGTFNYCRTHEVDLIGIPTHGRKGLAHFIYGSLGEDVANHSKIPVVTFRL